MYVARFYLNLYVLKSREDRIVSARMRGVKSKWGTKGSTIQWWLQSQEQKLLRARSGSVIRMLMRAAIGRGHPEPRGETHESPVALLKRGEAFFDGRHTHTHMRMYSTVAARWREIPTEQYYFLSQAYYTCKLIIINDTEMIDTYKCIKIIEGKE